MEEWILRAKSFAEETAKRSQEIALQTAKYSQDLAQETARKSRELAGETAKRAEFGLKAIVKELQSKGSHTDISNTKPNEEELRDFGVTPELREFLSGITIRTFRDFPLEGLEKSPEASYRIENGAEFPGTEKLLPDAGRELSEWQEHHALLVLQTVTEISDYRYVLCPRRMTENQFWKIYFVLVKSHLPQFGSNAIGKTTDTGSKAGPLEAVIAHATVENRELLVEKDVQTLSPATLQPPSLKNESKPSPEARLPGSHDQDLDAYLMDALGSGDEGEDANFNVDDFDDFVNGESLDSEGENAEDSAALRKEHEVKLESLPKPASGQ